jgi:DNA mismatch endonuclease (patch repair protein)
MDAAVRCTLELSITMSDVLTPQQRSRNMAAIKGKNTKPELIVRRLAHRLGYRFRLHRRDLPGSPDLVFPRLRKVIFVHGCYWHMHNCRWGRVSPKTNTTFWQTKRVGNVARDRRNLSAVRYEGWNVLVLWECQTRDPRPLEAKIATFLSS